MPNRFLFIYSMSFLLNKGDPMMSIKLFGHYIHNISGRNSFEAIYRFAIHSAFFFLLLLFISSIFQIKLREILPQLWRMASSPHLPFYLSRRRQGHSCSVSVRHRQAIPTCALHRQKLGHQPNTDILEPTSDTF